MTNCNTTSTECGCSSNAQHPVHPQPCVRPMPARSGMQQCPCGGRLPDPVGNMQVAMAYVPWQCFKNVYEPDKALQYGTIFPELNKPFYGKGGCPR